MTSPQPAPKPPDQVPVSFPVWSLPATDQPTQPWDVTAWVHAEVGRAARSLMSPHKWKAWVDQGSHDDATQTVLLQLLSEPYTHHTLSWAPPLRSSVQHRTLNLLRAWWRRTEMQYPEAPGDGADPPFESIIEDTRTDEPALVASVRERVREALATLKAFKAEWRPKEFAVLRAMERDVNHLVLVCILLGKEKSWICAYLDINGNTFNVRKSRGMAAFRRQWIGEHREVDWLTYEQAMEARDRARNDIQNYKQNYKDSL